jgi:hypothetical protein
MGLLPPPEEISLHDQWRSDGELAKACKILILPNVRHDQKSLEVGKRLLRSEDGEPYLYFISVLSSAARAYVEEELAMKFLRSAVAQDIPRSASSPSDEVDWLLYGNILLPPPDLGRLDPFPHGPINLADEGGLRGVVRLGRSGSSVRSCCCRRRRRLGRTGGSEPGGAGKDAPQLFRQNGVLYREWMVIQVAACVPGAL